MTRARALAALLALLFVALAAAPALAQDAQRPAGSITPELPATGAGAPQKKPSKRDLAIFWSIGGLAILGALAVITRKNPVTAVMSLVGTFLALSVVYVMLLAHFLAIIQVLVYAGAIMVLFVFVVMIINREESDAWDLTWKTWIGRGLGVAAGIFVAVRFITVLVRSTQALGLSDDGWTQEQMQSFGTTREIGHTLFTRYLFPFEAVSLLLLIAVVGALVLARPRDPVPTPGAAEPDESSKGGAH